MSRKLILLIVFLIIIAFLLGLFFNKIILTGKVVENLNKYSWTKAICNDDGCIDVLIECDSGKIVSMKPVSNFTNFENFSDTRGNLINVYC